MRSRSLCLITMTALIAAAGPASAEPVRPPPQPVGPTSSGLPSSIGAPETSRYRRTKPWWDDDIGWSTLVFGASLGLCSGWAFTTAADKEERANDLGRPLTWRASLRQDAEDWRGAAWTLAGTGAVVAAIGIAKLALFDRPNRPSTPTVAIGRSSITVGWTF